MLVTIKKIAVISFFFTHSSSSDDLPRLEATVLGDSIELNALIVALTTFTGFVDP